MTEWHELVRQIDSCHSLFLHKLVECDYNSFRIVLCEGIVAGESESMEVGGTTIENLHRVQPTDESRILELTWPSYVAYSVTNESFSAPEGAETSDSGRLLRRYSNSSFLAHITRSTIATDEYPGHYQDVQVVSENHIVDVVSTQLPSLRVLNRDDE